jgi:hypothetical protein
MGLAIRSGNRVCVAAAENRVCHSRGESQVESVACASVKSHEQHVKVLQEGSMSKDSHESERRCCRTHQEFMNVARAWGV